MIPKVIHYCWFGGNPLPELAQKCISSWKKYCPDYEIIEWNESNFDISCCDYVREAAKAKKWAFVSDYARFKILYENGGLYFDTDVEVLKPLYDIVKRGGFMGIEGCPTEADPGRSFGVAPGLGLAAAPGNGVFRDLMEEYHSRHFLNPDGSYNLTTIVVYTTDYLKSHGLEEKNCIQCVRGIYIYPKEYFCPMDNISGEVEITENSYSIHHYDASWLTAEQKREIVLMRKFQKYLPARPARYLAQFVSIMQCRGMKAAWTETIQWAVQKIGRG